jgi:hypothetical protein
MNTLRLNFNIYFLFFFSFLILFSTKVISQKEDHIWYFGSHAGLDFNSTSTNVLHNSALLTYDNSSTVSDSAGNLLFYSDGKSIYNKLHALMHNGNGLSGTNNSGQSSLIVPVPGSQSYYMFYFGDFGQTPLYYSIIDMSLQSGLGSVVQKNVPLFSVSTEKLAVHYDCNSEVFKIVTHQVNSNSFYVYKIDLNGLDTIPVISSIGDVQSSGPWGIVNDASGQLSISPDGAKIVSVMYASGTVEFFDFDFNTGTVTNRIYKGNINHAWGAEFSSDNSKVYISEWGGEGIYQFDVSSGDSSIIANTFNYVGSVVTGFGLSAGFLQRGPDAKIYIAKWNSDYIGVINDPNVYGFGCNVQDDAIFLGPGFSTAGLSRNVSKRCFTTSLSEYANKNDQITYYNADSKCIYVTFQNHEQELKDIKIEVYDALGKLVSVHVSEGINQIMIPAINLKKGIYFVRTDIMSKYYTSKTIVY